MARRRNPTKRALWIGGLLGGALLIGGGVAYAIKKQSPAPEAQCKVWTLQTSGSQTLVDALNLDSVGTGVHYFTSPRQQDLGQQVMYVNNTDGSLGANYTVAGDPSGHDTPSGSTSIYVCTG